jgi:hypothetical protein
MLLVGCGQCYFDDDGERHMQAAACVGCYTAALCAGLAWLTYKTLFPVLQVCQQ